MNEFNDFNEDSYDEENYNDGNFDYDNDDSFDNQRNANEKLKTYIVVGVVALVTFIVVFVVTNQLVNGGKKKTPPVMPTPEVEYTAYEMGDTVTLKDNSKWHVLYESKKDNEYVTLLSDEDINTKSVLYGNLNSFLKGTFKTDLVSKLGCDSSDIPEIRLLAYLDLTTISKADSSEFLPDVIIGKYEIPEFIYETETVTDTVYQTELSNNPILLCSKDRKGVELTTKSDDNKDTTDTTVEKKEVETIGDTKDTEDKEDTDKVVKGNGEKFCLGDPTEVLPVRPVLVIKKEAVTNGTKTVEKNEEEGNK